MMKHTGLKIVFAFTMLAFSAFGARADAVNVAVAANFTDTAKELSRVFRERTGHDAILSFGSSGQLYTQIKEHAPFEVFLSADEERPKKLVSEGLALGNEGFVYAIGKLVLWSKATAFVKNEETLKRNMFSKIAIANPAVASYGVAAVEVMKALGVYETLQPKIVQGNSIAQVFQFVNTDNAELGFIALSQIPNQKEGSWWVVPEKLYKPIRQGAVLLKAGEKSDAAKSFITFLKSPLARSIIQKSGYATQMIVSRNK